MFTGLVSDLGEVEQCAPGESGDVRLIIATRFDPSGIELGASIAVSGVCLSAVRVEPGRLGFDVSGETLSRTTLGALAPGAPVNLERSLRVGDALGGHWVSGHIDGLARLADVQAEGGSHRLTFTVPASLGHYLAPKGSVALDGVSLTVNEVSDHVVAGNAGPGRETAFTVNIIPHTWSVTTLGHLRVGERCNFEADLLARYAARLLEVRQADEHA